MPNMIKNKLNIFNSKNRINNGDKLLLHTNHNLFLNIFCTL